MTETWSYRYDLQAQLRGTVSKYIVLVQREAFPTELTEFN